MNRAVTGYMSISRTPLNLGVANPSELQASMTDALHQVQRLPLAVVLSVARLRRLPRILHGRSPMLRLLLDFQWNSGWA
eukprot:3138621-Pyramimonas_sp.AAC.1